jgi:AcrR family transcriptional regulator
MVEANSRSRPVPLFPQSLAMPRHSDQVAEKTRTTEKKWNFLTDRSVLYCKISIGTDMAPKRIDKEAKREQILRAAMEVFVQQGVYGFKMIDIARAANVGKGTLYEYFRSKEELVSGCLDLHMQDYFNQVKDWHDKALTPPEQIKRLIDLSFKMYVEHRERLTLIYDFWAVTFQHLRQNTRDAGWVGGAREFQQMVAEVIEKGIREGYFKPLDSRQAASTILAVIDGLLFQVILDLIDVSAEDLSDKVSAIILEGMEK